MLGIKRHEFRYQVFDIGWAVIRSRLYDNGDTFTTLSCSNRLAATDTRFFCDGTLTGLCQLFIFRLCDNNWNKINLT